MSLSISDALQQAHAAIDGGDYAGAADTCNRLVSQFPGYAAAYRLLGEAYREQGHAADAQSAFIASVTRNQRHPDGWYGLGLLAEEQGSVESALAFCQVSWELAPQQSHLRDPLTRIAMRRYAADGDLQLSRAALAQLYANASRLRRAADEFQAALVELPDRVDLQLGLAETLWRLDEQAPARRIAQDVLEQYPESAQALMILADIEHRAANDAQADDLLRRLRAVDPDGAVVAEAIAANPHADGAWLALSADAEPTLQEDAPILHAERPRLVPAPDFSYQPHHAEVPATQTDGLEPISLDEIGALPEDLAPFTPEEAGAGAPETISDAGSMLDGLDAFDLAEVEPASADATDADTLVNLGFEDFSTPEAAATAPDDLAALQREWDLSGVDDAVEQPAAESAQPSAGTDDLGDLAAAIEGDVADALARNGETVAPAADVDIELSRPAAQPPAGYTTVLRSLDSEGYAPFDPLRAHASSDLETPAASAAPDEVAGSGAQFADDWDAVDAEIADATPAGQPHGYTDELASLQSFGLEPFTLDDSGEEIVPFDPFSIDPMAPLPDMSVAPEPQATEQAPVPTPTPSIPAMEPDPIEDDLLVGLEPFSFEEIEQTRVLSEPEPFSMNQSIWDTTGTGSVVPSDEDLDALLALGGIGDDEPEAEAEAEISFDDAFASGFQTVRLDSTPEPEVQDAAEVEHAPADEDAMPIFADSDIESLLSSSGAVTRNLDFDFEQQGPEPEQAQEPEHGQAQDEADDHVAAAQPDVDLSHAAYYDSTNTLRPGTELFHRARVVKEELVSEGVIAGDRELFEESGEQIGSTWGDEDAIATRHLSESDAPDDDDSEIFGDAEFTDLPRAGEVTRDTDTLRAALEVTPDDDELHWWLAEALREQGDTADALSEYRWIIRNAPQRHDDVLPALESCVDRDREPETAHRLLADIYRRRGDAARASNHAALAMQSRRLSRVR
jgi:tetratricopeptide (TPR) repeat protein